ncbi:MAG: ATP-binding cassette domain-containing protein [Desulfobia sp.]
MITINSLTIQYSDKDLFKNVSCRLSPGDRIGLVGVNGSGKSTLLKILAGVTETDDGVISREKNITCGYLPQETSDIDSRRTLYEEAEKAFADLLARKKELEDIHIRLDGISPDDPEVETLLRHQGELQQILDYSGVYRMKAEIEKVLTGLGFKNEDLQRPAGQFSGGWLMRLMLAKQLLASPTYLFLDEPTNHLDLETLRWLEDFLNSFNGGLVIISHDRTFLENMTTSTWELSLGKLSVYKGNYASYVKQKEERLEIQKAAHANQQAKIEQSRRFIDRFRSKANKASLVQSRIKQLEKIKKIELDSREKKVHFRFSSAPPSGKTVLDVKDISKKYNSQVIFGNLNLEMQRGDKIAVVGINGAGKSTLARILAGEESADSGSVSYGHNVKPAYFGQHQALELPDKLTVLETISRVNTSKTDTELRSILGAFLFRGIEVDKKVSVLSGGEKSRLALACIVVSPANLLIMDEPTNHLDMSSQEILREALAIYEGSVLVISHNRYFLDQFINKVLEIRGGRGTLQKGTVRGYLQRLEDMQKNIEPERSQGNQKQKSGKSGGQGKKLRREQARIRQEKSRRLKPWQEKIARSEKEIEEMEDLKKELEQLLADPDLYHDQRLFAEKSKEYASINRKLTRSYERWEVIQEKVDKIEAEFAEIQ